MIVLIVQFGFWVNWFPFSGLIDIIVDGRPYHFQFNVIVDTNKLGFSVVQLSILHKQASVSGSVILWDFFIWISESSIIVRLVGQSGHVRLKAIPRPTLNPKKQPTPITMARVVTIFWNSEQSVILNSLLALDTCPVLVLQTWGRSSNARILLVNFRVFNSIKWLNTI